MYEEEVSDEIEALKENDCLPDNYDQHRKRRKSTGHAETEDNDIADELGELLKKEALPQTPTDSVHLKKRIPKHRSVKVSPLAEDGIPPNWTRNVSKREVFTLMELKRGAREFDEIESDMVSAGIKVLTIERLQNLRMLNKFKVEMKDVEQLHTSDVDLNICYLYHGTNGDKERLCEEGLDQRLSRMGHFGKGIYFSDTPAKCIQYTSGKVEEKSTPYILKCRVILGDTKFYPQGSYDTSLRREPEKEDHCGGWRYYDSVMGCPKDFNEYVIYENRRAMIEYIITFTPPNNLTGGKVGSPSTTFHYNYTDEEEPTEDCFVENETPSVDCFVEDQTPSGDCFEQVETSLHDRHVVRRRSIGECDSEIYVPEYMSEYKSSKKDDDTDLLLMMENLQCEETSPAFEAPDYDEDPNNEDESSYKVPSTASSNPASDICEFMQSTGVEDSFVARRYLQKADNDVNLAITYYYEDL